MIIYARFGDIKHKICKNGDKNNDKKNLAVDII